MKKTYSGCTRDSSHNDAKAAADIAKGFSKLSTPKHPDHGKQLRSMTTRAPKHYGNTPSGSPHDSKR
jgi:hypothetical protein